MDFSGVTSPRSNLGAVKCSAAFFDRGQRHRLSVRALNGQPSQDSKPSGHSAAPLGLLGAVQFLPFVPPCRQAVTEGAIFKTNSPSVFHFMKGEQ